MVNILFFEIFVIALTILLYFFMKKAGYKNIERKFIILGIAVLLFEIISEPLWMNIGLHKWTYIYSDVSWIMTLGWILIIMVSFMIVDNSFGHLSGRKKFWYYLFFIQAFTVPIEIFLVHNGIRGYAPELLATTSGYLIPFTSVTLDMIYGVPLFTALIITFYKYVNYIFDQKNGK